MMVKDAVPRRLYECVVCGRRFPHGQGIIMHKSGITLYFHSKACAAKFFKLFIERLDDSCTKGVLREILEELNEALKERREKVRKVI
jgi:hypothetical protein